MARETIELGIHLGATNSRIAVSRAGTASVIPSVDGAERTPTAVWLDEEEQIVVGERALSRLGSDPDNVLTGFVKLLGSGQVLRFARSSRAAEPTDLVAAIIRTLCADAGRELGRDVEDAVITAPARFTAAQRQALAVAARKAGLVHSPLLQEPVAAALAYGGPAEGATWLVYHFGGTTFDAALVTQDDGVVQVATHGHDDRVGGDQLDWEIVRKVFVPALFQEAHVTAFHSDNPRWRTAFAALRAAAEETRCKLESEDAAEVHITFLCRDDDGAPVPFRLRVDRTDLNRLLRVSVRRSIKVCEGLLKGRGLRFGDLERVVLAGGPVRDPYFTEALTGAGVSGDALATGIDPLTVIARGAALYASREPIFRPRPPVFVEGEEAVPQELPLAAEEAEEAPDAVETAAVEEEAAVEEAAATIEEAALAEKAPEAEEPPQGEGPPEAEGALEAEEEPAAEEAPEVEEEPAAEEALEAEEEPAFEGAADVEKEPAATEAAATAGAEALQPDGLTTEAEETAPEGDAGDSEERTIALAAEYARAGNHTDAKSTLRRLGPGEKLSPAALDMLIRVYTDQGRRDMAQLVWRFGKGRGAVEGEAYDAQYYALAAWSAGAKKAPAQDVAEPSTVVEGPPAGADEVAAATAAEPPSGADEVAEAIAEEPPSASEEPPSAPGEPSSATVETPSADMKPETPAEEPPPVGSEAPAVAVERPGVTVEWQPTAVEPPSPADEKTILAAAARAAWEGRYEGAAREMRRLGPVEKLSPAALDMLIRIYTREGELGRADLVWRYGKNRELVEGDSYDEQRYTLEEPPPGPRVPPTPETAGAPSAAEAAPVVDEAAPEVDEAAPVVDEAAPEVDEAAPVTAATAPSDVESTAVEESPVAEEPTTGAEGPAPADAAATGEAAILAAAARAAREGRHEDAEREMRRLGQMDKSPPAPAAETAAAEPSPSLEAGGDEAEILAAAALAAREGRHLEAKHVLRRLGPGEKLSPAGLDMLIRVYASEGRGDRAELVWRFGKSRGLVEGDAYDARDYRLDDWSGRPQGPVTPGGNVASDGVSSARPGSTGPFSTPPLGAAGASGPPGGGVAASLGGAGASPRPGAGKRGWRPPLVSALIIGVVLLTVAVILLVRGCDSSAGVTPTVSPTPQATLSQGTGGATTPASLDSTSAADPAAMTSPGPSPSPQPLFSDSSLDVPGITVDERGTLTVVTFDAGLFPSGVVEPTREGLRTLRELAAQLTPFRTALVVRVIGSADNVPVSPRCKYPSNSALALARAEMVADLLHVEAGLPSASLSTAIADASRPLASNSTPEGRARNRTVLLKIGEGSA